MFIGTFRYKYRIVKSVIFFFLSVITFAQDKSAIDSLSIQKESASLSVKITALNELCRIYTGIDNAKAKSFSALAIQNAINLKNPILIAQSKNRLGTLYDYLGLIDSANISYLAALKVFESYNDKSGIASVYQNIGVMYYFQSDFNKAIECYLKAIKLRTETNELDYVAKLQNNIAIIFRRQKKYDSAINYYNQALAIKLKFNDQEAIANSYINLGSAYLHKKDFDNAKLFLAKSLKINESLNSKINLAGDYLLLGEIYYDEKKFDLARFNINKAIEYAAAAESNDVLYNCYELLWQTHIASGDYKGAIAKIHEAANYKAKIFKKEKAAAIEKLNILYETEKKDKEILKLNADQEKEEAKTQFLLFGFIFTFMSLVITAVYFKKLQSKNKLLSFQKREIEDKTHLLNLQAAEIATFRAQMNPHFIFNALVTVQMYILKEDKFNAAKYLTQLAKLMRLTLDNSQKEYISIGDEKQFLNFYIEFEQLGSENLFTYKLNIDEVIDLENTLIPPMIIQPFIENSIKHGLSPKISSGELIVSISKQKIENHFFCLAVDIKDNGVGRLAANDKLDKVNKHPSKGINITVSRLKSMCIANGMDNSDCFNIIDLYNESGEGNGTMIKLRMPFIEKF